MFFESWFDLLRIFCRSGYLLWPHYHFTDLEKPHFVKIKCL
jgi:hypothetical protein